MSDVALEREIYLGILHMLYHLKWAGDLYCPSRIQRLEDCRFCPKPPQDPA